MKIHSIFNATFHRTFIDLSYENAMKIAKTIGTTVNNSYMSVNRVFMGMYFGM